MSQATGFFTCHYDMSGNMIAITNDTGAVAAKFAYTPFGEVIDSVINQPACDMPVGFAGQFGVLREPNGLYYMNARFYDPTIGRFLSEDPAGLSGGDLTLYSYAGNNPWVFVDPSGLCSQSSGGRLSTALLGLASNGLESFGNSMMTTSEVLFGGSMAAFGAAGISEIATGGTSTPFSLGAAAYGTGTLSLSGYVATAGALSLGAAQFAKGEYAEGAISLILSVSGKPAEHIAETVGATPTLQGLSEWILEKYNESLVTH